MFKMSVVTILLLVCIVPATSGTMVKKNVSASKQWMFEFAQPDERNAPGQQGRPVPPGVPPTRTLPGIYTGISGFFDYQVNAGASQYIRVDRTVPTGNVIHIIMMETPDSTAPIGPLRGTYYAYSTNAGVTWNTFNLLRVPDRRSGYPSLDMLQGLTQGTIIGNHNDPGTGLTSFVYVDSPPGSGAFAELAPPGPPFGGDEPIWADVTGAGDGSISVSASRSTAQTGHLSRTSDFVSWSSWLGINPTGSAGLPMKSNTTGRVGCVLNTSFGINDGVYLFESTNNGGTWPSGQMIFPATRIVGPDTFSFNLGSDLVYNGNTAYMAVGEANIGLNAPTDSAQITFWSQPTGFVPAATKVNTQGVTAFEHLPTLNTTTLDMPSIGMSGTVIVIAYQAMMNNDTSLTGYNNCDIFLVQSNNGGQTWTVPRNVSNSPGRDDRFASISPWNPPGFVNLVWQEDPEAGGNIIGDPGATAQRTRQVFLRTALVGVDEHSTTPASFSLGQNYPNPFNPSTLVDYTVAKSGRVTIKVYNLLGEEVRTLVNDILQPGSYQATFNASSLPSGVYIYQLKAGSYIESRKMMLLK